MLVGAYVGAVPGALVGGLVGSVLDYMNRPQAVNPPHDPQPDPVAEHRRGLAASARHFSETGRPRYPQLANVYPNGVDTQRWVALTGLEDISKVKKKARSGNQQAKHSLVKHLFHKFTTYGFNYEIMSGYALCLLDSNYAKDSAEGNCLAYAKAFADILNSFGIDATQKSVRKESEGRFIVKVDDFIDPKVRGHIYEKGQLKQGYYMFTSHAATWVPSENKFYDPMAKISYTSLAPYIECEIASDKNEVVFWPTTRPKTLVPHYKWKLIRRQKTGPGGFHRTDLVPLNKK